MASISNPILNFLHFMSLDFPIYFQVFVFFGDRLAVSLQIKRI